MVGRSTRSLAILKNLRRVKRTQERAFSAHHMLTHAAERALEAAERERKGSQFGYLSAMLFSALAMEALCNSIGQRIVEDWEDFSSCNPIAKLRLLAERLGIDYVKDKEPWSTARSLIKFRNALAHAKPELIVEEMIMTHEEHDKGAFDVPASKLERLVTRANAIRAVAEVEKIEHNLLKRLPRKHAMELKIDHWTSRAVDHDG